MTAEERVKKVYPDARCYHFEGDLAEFYIVNPADDKELGYSGPPSEESAWADAAARIEVEGMEDRAAEFVAAVNSHGALTAEVEALRKSQEELVEALNFVQTKCQLYGAADAARNKIDIALSHAASLSKPPEDDLERERR